MSPIAGGKHLLFLCHRIPFPPDKGEKIRGWHVLSHLARSWQVHLGCLVDDPADLVHVERLRTICASVGAFRIDRRMQTVRAILKARPGQPMMTDFYHSERLRSWVDKTLASRKIDTVYILTVAMAPYVVPGGGRRLFLDAIDVDSEKWTEYGRRTGSPMRAVWAREGRNLLAYERLAAGAAAGTFFVSEPEASMFGTLAPECAASVSVIGNGVDLERFSPALGFASPFGSGPGSGCGGRIVFAGHMDYRPNEDAAAWFADGVMPRLRARRPGVEFWVVGANPRSGLRALERRGDVRVTGRVEDVRPYVAHADLVVCPLRIARGIQNKLLEAMAMGRPVVASPAAFEGVRAAAGRDLLVAGGADGFADAVMEVLEGRHGGLAVRARRAMEEGYDWDRTLEPLDRLLAG